MHRSGGASLIELNAEPAHDLTPGRSDRIAEGGRRQGELWFIRNRLADASGRRAVQDRDRRGHRSRALPWTRTPAANDLLAGQLQVMFPSVPDMLTFIAAGKACE